MEGRTRSKDVLSKVSQLEGMVIDEHPVPKEALKVLVGDCKIPSRKMKIYAIKLKDAN